MMTISNAANWIKTSLTTLLLLSTGLISTVVNAAPTVTLTAPAAASKFGAPASITLTADATVDAGQTISNVKFYRGTTLIATDITAPYSATWSNAAAGTYSLTARVTSNTNQIANSAAVSITVTASPTVALSAPANNAGFATGSNITVTATATPSTGQTITQVEFFANTVPATTPILIGTDTSSPYSVTWSTAPAGSYTLTAKATDNLSGTKTSSARTINVTTPPTVTLTAPAANTNYGAPATVTLTANATADAGQTTTPQTITQVQFYRGTTLIGTDTTAPYSVTWSNAAAGTYSLTAKATTNLTLTTTTPATSIVIKASPTTALTAPANNTSFTANPSITVSATASATTGQTITQVEFFANTVPATTPIVIGTDTTAPYSVSWNSVPSTGGSYSLTSKATDNLGGTKISTARTVTVAAAPINIAPTVSITAPANNATYTAPASIVLTATATDSDGTISNVKFYDGTTLVGTGTQQGTTNTYNFNWNNVAQGSYTNITAIATDNSGNTSSNTTSSAPIQLTVTQGVAQVYYIHTDQLNTPRLITNAANAKVWEWNNDDPFANNVPNENPSNLGTFVYNPRLPGQYFDRETNTHYNYFRDYDPSTGRYIESDPIGLAGGINTYGYVGGNPLSYTDAYGLQVVVEGTSAQRASLNNALNKIRRSDSVLARRLDALERSKNKHTIRYPLYSEPPQNYTTGKYKYNDSNGVGTGTDTACDPTKTIYDYGVPISGEATLAHELLGHGYEKDRGEINRALHPTKNMRTSESNAIEVEIIYQRAVNEAPSNPDMQR